jgi:hypothetical protein
MSFFKNIFNNSATHSMKVKLFMTFADQLKDISESVEIARKRQDITAKYKEESKEYEGDADALNESRERWIRGIKEVDASRCSEYTISTFKRHIDLFNKLTNAFNNANSTIDEITDSSKKVNSRYKFKNIAEVYQELAYSYASAGHYCWIMASDGIDSLSEGFERDTLPQSEIDKKIAFWESLQKLTDQVQSESENALEKCKLILSRDDYMDVFRLL